MTEGTDVGDTGQASGAPIDFDRLEVIRDRLATDDRFVRIEKRSALALDRLVYVYDPGLYPGSVEQAYLEIVWYENGDFSLHYHEDDNDGVFDHRWDRHPSGHNTRDHIHPGRIDTR